MLSIMMSLVGETRAALKVTYSWSKNNVYGTRFLTGDGDNLARATILRFDADRRRYDALKEIGLPHEYMPLEIVVTNDGQFLVTLGNYTGDMDHSSEIVIVNVVTGARKTFSLDDLFPTNDLKQAHTFAPQPPLYRLWFEEVSVDEASQKIVLTGLNQTDRSKPPTIVIDLRSMSVERTNASFWKARYDAQRLHAKLLEDRYTEALDVEQYHLYRLILLTLEKPQVTHHWVGMDVLFRLEPGRGTRPAKLLMTRRNNDSNGFEFVRTIELRNPIAPYLCDFSPDGEYLITFDEIDQVGATKNAIVIYHLNSGRRRGFALEDVCSKGDLSNILSQGAVRLWRIGRPWVTYVGKDTAGFDPYSPDRTGLLPHMHIDLQEMTVRMAAPFRRKTLRR